MEKLRSKINIPRSIAIFAFMAILCMTGIAGAVVYHGNETIISDTMLLGYIRMAGGKGE